MNYSFIIPVYNCKSYLPACVESIRKVGAQNYEILLIDDGSTDGSSDVCNALALQYPEIRVIHQKNFGVSAARNLGIREAKGDYILFVDSDDLLLPFDETIFRSLEAGDVDWLMFGMVFRYYHNDQFVKEERLVSQEKGIYTPETIGEAFESLFYSNYFSPVWNKFFKKSCLVENELYFDSRLTNYEDLAFSLQVMSRCSKIAVVPEAYYLYRVDYDHDHTVDRIAKIDDIMGNTDLIAERFMELERAMASDGSEVEALRKCLLGIYFELFGVKTKTTPLNQIKKYCRDFVADKYVQMCLPYLSERSRKMYDWIAQENAYAIWMRHRYIEVRHFVARNLKRLLRKG